MDEMKSVLDQLNYELFLAEQSLKMSLNSYDNKAMVVSEAADIIALNEGVADTIKKYLAQVTNAIQKAWNNFKTKIDGERIHLLLDKNGKYLSTDFKMKMPEEFEYPELNVWEDINNNCTVGDHLLDAGNYAQFKDYLETSDKFLAQYYPNWYEEGKKISEVFNEKCFSKADANHVVDNKLATQYSEFLLSYKDSINGIQEDIDAINKVNQNMESMIKQLVGESTVYIGKVLLEAPEDNNQQQQNNPQDDKNKFRNADPNAPKKDSSTDRKNIVNYYKAMTTILSAKMRTCNKVKNNSIRILTNYIKLQGGQVGVIPNKSEKKFTATANERTPQVK